MKLLKKQISAKDASGTILVRPDTPEDLWHIYNLVRAGDCIRCTTLRKVVKETSTGSTSSAKKRLILTIQMEKIEFDPDALELRLSGIVQSENEQVRLGSHHTLSVELNQNLSIEKNCWDQIYLDIIDEAIHPENQAEVGAIVLQPTGLAHVCLITGSLTITKAKIDINIPKKRTGTTQHSKSVAKFYDSIYQAVVRHYDFGKIKCVVLGSPGFSKNDLYDFMIQQATKANNKVFLESKNKFVLCKASSGHKHSIEELLQDPTVLAQMSQTKIVQEVEVLTKFMRMLDIDPDRAYYGYDHVNKAQTESLAVDKLLVTDELFRSSDIVTRKKYVQLVEDVRASGGSVHILSVMHVSGQQLQQVSGVAAILRFPLPDLDEIEEKYNLALLAETAKVDGQESYTDNDGSDDSAYDPARRIREDLQDMGL